nr:MAG TPA: hypothetical protein [Caudoviricetes sp.]
MRARGCSLHRPKAVYRMAAEEYNAGTSESRKKNSRRRD